MIVTPQDVFVKGVLLSQVMGRLDFGRGVLIVHKSQTKGSFVYLIAPAKVLDNKYSNILHIVEKEVYRNPAKSIDVEIANVILHPQDAIGVMPIADSNIFEVISEDYFIDSQKVVAGSGYPEAIQRQLQLAEKVSSQSIIDLLNQIKQ